jgi:hypothetical protein
MNPTRLDDVIATRHLNNLMLRGQRRDDSDTLAPEGRQHHEQQGGKERQDQLLDKQRAFRDAP